MALSAWCDWSLYGLVDAGPLMPNPDTITYLAAKMGCEQTGVGVRRSCGVQRSRHIGAKVRQKLRREARSCCKLGSHMSSWTLRWWAIVLALCTGVCCLGKAAHSSDQVSGGCGAFHVCDTYQHSASALHSCCAADATAKNSAMGLNGAHLVTRFGWSMVPVHATGSHVLQRTFGNWSDDCVVQARPLRHLLHVDSVNRFVSGCEEGMTYGSFIAVSVWAALSAWTGSFFLISLIQFAMHVDYDYGLINSCAGMWFAWLATLKFLYRVGHWGGLALSYAMHVLNWCRVILCLCERGSRELHEENSEQDLTCHCYGCVPWSFQGVESRRPSGAQDVDGLCSLGMLKTIRAASPVSAARRRRVHAWIVPERQQIVPMKKALERAVTASYVSCSLPCADRGLHDPPRDSQCLWHALCGTFRQAQGRLWDHHDMKRKVLKGSIGELQHIFRTQCPSRAVARMAAHHVKQIRTRSHTWSDAWILHLAALRLKLCIQVMTGQDVAFFNDQAGAVITLYLHDGHFTYGTPAERDKTPRDGSSMTGETLRAGGKRALQKASPRPPECVDHYHGCSSQDESSFIVAVIKQPQRQVILHNIGIRVNCGQPLTSDELRRVLAKHTKLAFSRIRLVNGDTEEPLDRVWSEAVVLKLKVLPAGFSPSHTPVRRSARLASQASHRRQTAEEASVQEQARTVSATVPFEKSLSQPCNVTREQERKSEPREGGTAYGSDPPTSPSQSGEQGRTPPVTKHQGVQTELAPMLHMHPDTLFRTPPAAQRSRSCYIAQGIVRACWWLEEGTTAADLAQPVMKFRRQGGIAHLNERLDNDHHALEIMDDLYVGITLADPHRTHLFTGGGKDLAGRKKRSRSSSVSASSSPSTSRKRELAQSEQRMTLARQYLERMTNLYSEEGHAVSVEPRSSMAICEEDTGIAATEEGFLRTSRGTQTDMSDILPLSTTTMSGGVMPLCGGGQPAGKGKGKGKQQSQSGGKNRAASLPPAEIAESEVESEQKWQQALAHAKSAKHPYSKEQTRLLLSGNAKLMKQVAKETDADRAGDLISKAAQRVGMSAATQASSQDSVSSFYKVNAIKPLNIGEDTVNKKQQEQAYNYTLVASDWERVAKDDADLLEHGGVMLVESQEIASALYQRAAATGKAITILMPSPHAALREKKVAIDELIVKMHREATTGEKKVVALPTWRHCLAGAVQQPKEKAEKMKVGTATDRKMETVVTRIHLPWKSEGEATPRMTPMLSKDIHACLADYFEVAKVIDMWSPWVSGGYMSVLVRIAQEDLDGLLCISGISPVWIDSPRQAPEPLIPVWLKQHGENVTTLRAARTLVAAASMHKGLVWRLDVATQNTNFAVRVVEKDLSAIRHLLSQDTRSTFVLAGLPGNCKHDLAEHAVHAMKWKAEVVHGWRRAQRSGVSYIVKSEVEPAVFSFPLEYYGRQHTLTIQPKLPRAMKPKASPKDQEELQPKTWQQTYVRPRPRAGRSQSRPRQQDGDEAGDDWMRSDPWSQWYGSRPERSSSRKRKVAFEEHDGVEGMDIETHQHTMAQKNQEIENLQQQIQELKARMTAGGGNPGAVAPGGSSQSGAGLLTTLGSFPYIAYSHPQCDA